MACRYIELNTRFVLLILCCNVASNGAVDNSTLSNTLVGFGTAALRPHVYDVVTTALNAGFRVFDTAEESDWWYDQESVGQALTDFYSSYTANSYHNSSSECVANDDQHVCQPTGVPSICETEKLSISTKIPPWRLTSIEEMRQSARYSRQQLLGWCDEKEHSDTTTDLDLHDGTDDIPPSMKTEVKTQLFSLDIYYIHAPRCWDGWHPRCTNAPPTMSLRQTYTALEYIVGVDHSAQRIGLSNVHPHELMDIIRFVQERQQPQTTTAATATTTTSDTDDQPPPPRMPDVVQAFADPIAPNKELRHICAQYNIEFISYSTLVSSTFS
jgi:diketogulonate reductase-like aldo/keto reductase